MIDGSLLTLLSSYTTLKTKLDFKKIYKKPTQDTKVNFISTFSTDSTELRSKENEVVCSIFGRLDSRN